jgi:redox-sensing transcriptional repressor
VKTIKVPEATIARLSVYSRFLRQLDENGVAIISSGEIAKGVDGSPAQVRKDLAYFGEFGIRGVGYKVKDLNEQITKILGLTYAWDVIIVGAGNLGSAITHYKGFKERGFNIVALFDKDKKKIGLTIGDAPIYDISQMEKYIRNNKVKIGVIAVPVPYAQKVVDVLVNAGIQAILNFTPCVVTVPEHVEFRKVDLAVNMELLTFNLVNYRNII